MTVLVVGARPGSLGAALVGECLRTLGGVVRTWGLHDEGRNINLLTAPMGTIRSALILDRPTHVLCTVGVNVPEIHREGDDPKDWYDHHWHNNVVGPMRLLTAWRDVLRKGVWEDGYELRHFVAISSNSATVPRSGSTAYCASKAGLSQALRCAARELQGGDLCGLVAYGYEPGLLVDTPMTDQTAEDFRGLPLTRMRGKRNSQGISPHELARVVVAGLGTGTALNGVLVPFDGGER